MKISLITPAPPRSRRGNRVTAISISRFLRGLGHKVHIEEEYQGRRCDLMIALHARRSFPSIRRFRDRHPDLPLILTLTGTDLYKDIRTDANAKKSLEFASRLVVLQPMGIQELPERFRKKARVIVQSFKAPAGNLRPRKNVFEVCVLGHLRSVKDPFRAAKAARLLDPASSIQVTHVGGALTKKMEQEARKESASNPRYRWIGEVPRWKAIRFLARSRLHVLSSEMEGGANALCEAIACSVPTLASRISGSIGLLGEDYPGFFPLKDTETLASLLERAERDPLFYGKL
ncbi:MAG: selenoneine biosynthesis selenosugar synthase SenB, partial [bacterium]